MLFLELHSCPLNGFVGVILLIRVVVYVLDFLFEIWDYWL